ncbi:hypothetical protein [Acinetobacter colistiniresistens]|uniref:hypothetical protein n=2 Tax=Acinetobacter TaxID=469 RepID=UPI002FE1C7E9
MTEIEAVIEAAKIQANSTFMAAIIAAIGLGLGVVASWFTGLHLQKKDKIAETRREVYSQLIETYSTLTAVLSILILHPNEAQQKYTDAITAFSTSLDKAMFVCETSTKKEIVQFLSFFLPAMSIFSDKLFNFLQKFEELMIENEKHQNVLKEFTDIRLKITDIKIDNPQDQRIQNILNLLNEKISETKKIVEQLSKVENEYKLKMKELHDEQNEINEQITDKALSVMYLLRQEIGIKNDTKQDFILNQMIKNIKH